MATKFRPKDKRCYILIGYAAKGTTFRKANLALNEFVSDPKRGLVLFHDHFMGTPGGVAFFWVENAEQLKALKERGFLKGWRIKIHPLIFVEDPVSFLYQADFTLTAYRKRRLGEFVAAYEQSKLKQDIDGRATQALP